MEAGNAYVGAAALGVTAMVLDVRLGDSYTYFAARSPALRVDLLRRLLRIEFSKDGLLVLLGITVSLAVALTGGPWTLYAAAIPAAAVGGPIALLSSHLLATGRSARLSVLRGVSACVGLGAQLALITTLGGAGYSLGLGVGGASLLLLMSGSGRVSGTQPGVEGSRVELPARREFVSYTATASLVTTVSALGDRFAPIAVSLAGGAAMAASFRVATSLGRLFAAVISPVAGVLFPELSHLASAGQFLAMRRRILHVSVILGGGAIIASLVAWPITGWLIHLLYGPHYDRLGVPASVFLIGVAVRQLAPWSKVLALAVGRPLLRLIAMSVESAAVLLCTLLLAQLGLGPVSIGYLAIAVFVSAYWLAIAVRLPGNEERRSELRGEVRRTC
ncbi:MAG: lipopolysaccharide biosynthesis protein [Acidimicrobiia bacterium]